MAGKLYWAVGHLKHPTVKHVMLLELEGSLQLPAVRPRDVEGIQWALNGQMDNEGHPTEGKVLGACKRGVLVSHLRVE